MLYTLGAIILVGLGIAVYVYKIFLGPSVTDSQPYFYVYTNDTYENVLRRIRTDNIVSDVKAFDYAAKAMKYPNSVKAGRYKTRKGHE